MKKRRHYTVSADMPFIAVCPTKDPFLLTDQPILVTCHQCLLWMAMHDRTALAKHANPAPAATISASGAAWFPRILRRAERETP